MDRQISKEQLAREKRGRIVKSSLVALFVLGMMVWFSKWMRTNVNRDDISISVVGRGTIEISVTASGKVVPSVEEIVNSPITTRIVEVYRRGGDSVDVGTPILKLDLQTAETDFQKLQDQERMKYYELERMKVDNDTYLSDLAMKVEVEQMRLNRQAVELRNERYLDSLGSGTTDKVRQAELAYNTALLELKQLRQQLENERKVKAAELKIKELELNISAKSLAEMQRTLQNAQIRSPRKGILTFINTQVGAQIGQGTQVAIVSDLSRFKVEAEISDNYGDRLAAGGKVIVKSGSRQLEGVVSSVTPLSRNGVIAFSVQLDDDNNKMLRSGLKVDAYVMNAVKENVLRIRNGSYYQGAGEYGMFVVDGEHELVRRTVVLGESNFEFVEVVDGLKEGEQVVISNMGDYQNKNKLKLK